MEIRLGYWEANATDDEDFVQSLYSLASPESMQLRKLILSTCDETITTSIALSLQGVDTPESMEVRGLLNDTNCLISLEKVASHESMVMRTDILVRASDRRDTQTHLEIIESLRGIDTPDANYIRRTIANHRLFKPHLKHLVESMCGCGSAEAINLYHDLINKAEVSEYEVLETLQGVGTSESIVFRKKMLDLGRGPLHIARSLIGTYTDAAMNFRERTFGKDPALYLESLANTDNLA